jgi:hypothetical protein
MQFNYFLIVLTALFMTAQRVLQKQFNKGERYGGVWFFNTVMCAAAALFFGVYFAVDSRFNRETLAYSAVFAVCFT